MEGFWHEFEKFWTSPLQHCFWSELKSFLLYCLYFFTFFYVLTGNLICCWQLFREAWEQPGHWSHGNTGKFYQVTWILTVIPRGLSCKTKSMCSHWFCIIASVLHGGISAVVQSCRFQFVLQSGPVLRTEYSTSLLISCFRFVGIIISFRYACLNFIHFCIGSSWCNKTFTQSTWEDEMCNVLLNHLADPINCIVRPTFWSKLVMWLGFSVELKVYLELLGNDHTFLGMWAEAITRIFAMNVFHHLRRDS